MGRSTTDPDGVEALLQKGTSLRASGDLAAAERTFLALLAQAPDHIDGRYQLGVVQHLAGRPEASLETLREVARRAPGAAAVHLSLGSVLLDLGRDAEARASYMQALGLQEGLAVAWERLGDIDYRAKMYAESERAYARALELGRDAPRLRLRHAMVLRGLDRWPEALDALLNALRQAPKDYELQRNYVDLLYLHILGGKRETAREHARAFLAGPVDEAFRAYIEGMFGFGAAPVRHDGGFIRAHFDAFADDFDTTLRGLGYRIPEQVLELVLPHVEGTSLEVLDLGCGTGLFGQLIRDRAPRLVGVDLSPRMLEHASARGVYDELVEADILAYLARESAPWDLVTALDVLNYLGDPSPVISAVTGALRHGGLFACSIEVDEAGVESFRMQSSGRYTHAPSAFEKVLEEAGLVLLKSVETTLRREANSPVAGKIYVARRPTPGTTVD